MTTIAVTPIDLALAQAREHERLADEATIEGEKRAHRSVMRALDKAVMEMSKGNTPQRVADGIWMVASRTTANVVYRVDVQTQRCTCENRDACWHLAAANVCEEARVAEARDAADATVVRSLAATFEGGQAGDVDLTLTTWTVAYD